jgi:hypothetical protein
MTLWLMVIAQMLVWGWFSFKGGKLSDKKFLVFTVGMLLGQLAAGSAASNVPGRCEASDEDHSGRAAVAERPLFLFRIFCYNSNSI